MKELAGLTALIIEPRTVMRDGLHHMFNQCGVTKIDHAASSSVAVRTLRNKSYDMILCEYDLGDGQDGQQLLEDLRHNKLLPLTTVFFIVTAERSYEKVVSTAEFTPTDYILKPFNADTLLERIRRAVEKRAAFLPVYRLMEEGNLREAVAACVTGETTHRRYAIDFLRLRAELHVAWGDLAAAEALYRELVSTKNFPWARLGIAKTLFMQQRYPEAKEVLTNLVAENNKFLDAYDWLAKTYEASNQLEDAKKILEDAVAVSPHAVRRLRKLGDVALVTGDINVAERSFQKVVLKAKYSEYRDPEDHVRLIASLVAKGDEKQAATVIRDMEKSLGGMKKTAACRAYSVALLHQIGGDTERTGEELSAAVAACRDSIGLSNEIKMSLARTCLENNFEAGAAEVMLQVMSNATDNAAMEKASNIFEQAGRKDLAESVAKESRRRVVDLISTGAEKAKNGDYDGAVALMTEAARTLPDNPQVVFNAALALLKCLENSGWDRRLGERARWYIENSRRLDSSNPRLTPLTDLYEAVLRKYGVSAAHVAARAPIYD
jgi:DNA-binding NarL/FixJ family response regulator/lipopolysaccharide biosynthesis regulator YciM